MDARGRKRGYWLDGEGWRYLLWMTDGGRAELHDGE